MVQASDSRYQTLGYILQIPVSNLVDSSNFLSLSVITLEPVLDYIGETKQSLYTRINFCAATR